MIHQQNIARRTEWLQESITRRLSWVVPLCTAIIALLLVGAFGRYGAIVFALCIGVCLLVTLLVLNQYEVAAVLVTAIALYLDWYLVYRVLALITAVVLLVCLFLTRSSKQLWTWPRAIGLWIVFLILAIPPTIEGALTQHDLSLYYPGVILAAFIMFWLGAVVGHNPESIRRFFSLFALFATVLALHTLVQSATGVFLFASTRGQATATLDVTASIQAVGSASSALRYPGFFLDPNWNGAFFAMALFLPIGLFVTGSSLSAKLFHIAQAILILLALLLTLSTGSWTAFSVGLVVFILLMKGKKHYVQIGACIFIAAFLVFVGFSSRFTLLLLHSTDAAELLLRRGAWETALRVMQAFPLSGVGLGHLAYLERAEPYRVPAQSIPLDHPHNSYLELGAMAGIPVLLLFLVLLLFALWHAWRNQSQASAKVATLLGAGIAAIVTVSVNSWSINVWTLPPLGACGWMLLGMLSSPLLARWLVGRQDMESTSSEQGSSERGSR